MFAVIPHPDAHSQQALYLDPLRERVRKNGGRVYANGPEFTLLIDLKSDWRTIYPEESGSWLPR